MNSFTHSGDIGDLIYSLPAIRAKGGGILYLRHTHGRTVHGMSEDKCERIKPLLLAQPYIKDVIFDNNAPDSSLDGFRDHGYAGNLADMHLATQGLSWEHRSTPWLKVTPNAKYKVVFIRTQRYNNKHFDWGRIYRKYAGDAVFMGFDTEHAIFEKTIGPIPRVVTSNFLEIAEYIAGCQLFVGNYTSLTAIAEGLKHPQMIVEVCPSHHALGVFERFGCLLAWDNKIELPSL